MGWSVGVVSRGLGVVDRVRRLQHRLRELVRRRLVCRRLMRRRLEHALLPALRLEHALLPRPRLEHALLRSLRLGGARFGAAEFQPVEEAPAALELGCWRRSIALALGFFRPRRRATHLLGGAAANIPGPDVPPPAMLPPPAGAPPRPRRRPR